MWNYEKVFLIFSVRCNKLMPLHTQQQAKNGRGGGDNLDRGEYNVNKGFLNEILLLKLFDSKR